MLQVTGQAALIFRMVRREIPHSLRHFAILIACIALGVGAIVAVISLSRALEGGLAREGRTILGADAAFTLIQREANTAEQAALARHGTIARIIASRAMGRAANGESLLVEVKSVDPAAYPGIGALVMEGKSGAETRGLGALLAPDATGLAGVVVDPLLTGRLGLGLGDSITIGERNFRIAAHLLSEPDKLSGGLGFGPRVIMAQADFLATGLIQPGALTRYTYRLTLPDGTEEDALEAMLDNIAKEVPEAGWQVATRLRAAPQLQRQINRFTQFLTLVGLTALLVGGVGVANAARAFADKQVLRIATLKSLGASTRFVFISALAQVLAFALIGIGIGLVLGASLPALAAYGLGDLLPFPLAIGIYPQELALGLAYGLVTAFAFSLWPIMRARAVPASALFRDGFGDAPFRPGLWDIVLLLTAFGGFAALVILSASDQRIARAYLGAAIAAIIALRLLAIGVMAVARRIPAPRNPVFRLALANLHRRGSLTPSVMLSLGMGLTLLVTLTLIDINLTRQFRSTLPGLAPSFFFIDIPSREMDRFEAFLTTTQPGAKVERVPQLRGRITAIKGIPAADYPAAERISWVLEGDRGITFAAKPPEGSMITQGTWWEEGYRGTPLVSFAKDVADGLDLNVGDEISVNVLGRNFTARVANLREVRWQRLGINFVMVFSPNTFAGAPYTYLATITPPAGPDMVQDSALARAVSREFPAVSAVRVRDALEAVDKVVSQLALAIRASSLVALLASLLVLGGALAATTRTRQREGVILKTLGGTRTTLLQAMVVEYAALGAIAVVFGLLCGAAGASFVVSGLMNLEFNVDWAASLSIAFSSFLLTIILGLLGTWHLLGQKPAPYLRNA